MTETAAHSEQDTIPAEIDRWNWGAFLLTWIWGVGNNTFIALLTFVPFFGMVIMPFVLGAKGSTWAWRNRRWDSVEHFKRVQRSWAIWGAVIWLALIVLFGGIFGSIFYSLNHSEAYQMGVAKLRTSSEVAEVLGVPISTGTPLGTISIEGPSGGADLNFSVTGTKAEGRAFLRAIKKNGVWSIQSFTVEVDGRDEPIDLLNSDQRGI